MNITITGSLGNISKPLSESLIRAGHRVTIISNSADKKAAIEALGATAAIGSVEDISFLTSAFRGADGVYTMVPPNFGAAHWRQYIAGIGSNYAAAIRSAGVTRVVNLSSIGAHLPGGTGPIAGLHDVEQILNSLEGVSVKHLRPAFFYINFLSNIDMIKHMNILGSNYGEDRTLVMVHPDTIAGAAAEEIQSPFKGGSNRYIANDVRKAGEIAAVLGAAIGKPGLKWVEFSDEQALAGMQQGGLSEEVAKNYVEMGTAIQSGKLWEDYDRHKPAVLGEKKLEQFAVEFAAKYVS